MSAPEISQVVSAARSGGPAHWMQMPESQRQVATGRLVILDPVPPVPMTSPSPVPGPTAYAPVQNTKDNPPCNTLFIGNLGETVVEEELRGLFCLQPGFKQMKVLRQDRNTVCFIEFEDVSAASVVHHTLQGAVIPSSGRGGMRIQFSKNPFGRRKDLVGGMVGTVNGAPA